MCEIKAMFFKLEECVIEYHPPKSNYVNKCETCLHLWRPIYEEIPMPPMMYVLGGLNMHNDNYNCKVEEACCPLPPNR